MVNYGICLTTRSSVRGYIAKRLTIAGFALALWMGTTGAAKAAQVDDLERHAFLHAIAEVETGGNARAIGRKGERGMFQFTRTTWRLHSQRAFADAHIPSVSFEIAARHYDWLYDGLLRNGRQPTPYLMAAAWNAGLGRVVNGQLPRSSRDYATRVVNIVSVTKPSIPVAIAVEPAILIASDR
ncbi:MAG: lytic transglycosylase domain-containing protein [Opitutaceae bacterium]|nr:lytic transglycosylase domain-containing protein [Opitutaceae bacterium]